MPSHSTKKTHKQPIDPPLTKAARRGRAITLTLVALIIIYILGIINPITGPSLRYPYMVFYCGQRPVVATDFMAAHQYETPDLKSYDVNMFSKFYCTEEEAQAAGYQKSPAP